jgi:capsule polysaccharide export protein KpsE/RkpR
MLSERAKKVKDWSTFLELFEATAILVIIMLIFIGLFRIIWYLIKKSFNAKSELYSEMANIIEEEILFEKIK